MKFVQLFDPKTEINFVEKFKSIKLFMLALPVISLVSMVFVGFNWGIDFSGGSEMQVKFARDVSAQEIRAVLAELGFDKNQVQSYGEAGQHEMLVRVENVASLTDAEVNSLTTLLKSTFGPDTQLSFNDNLGDRVVVKLKVPAVAEGSDLATAIAGQKAALAQLIEEKGGKKLRRTQSHNESGVSTNEAIIHSDPENGEIDYTVQFMGITDEIGQALTKRFENAEIRRVEFVDSQVSHQLRTDGALAVIYALLAILVYIAIRFDILFAPGAIVALLQDTLGAVLIFTLGRLEFDLPSVAALLTVVGYSINNTIVVYDRIRETVPKNDKKPPSYEMISQAVNKSVNDTLSRTINTTLTTLFSSVCLWIFAGGVIKSFAMALTVGIVLGAFSSTFTAPVVYLLMKKHFAHKVGGRTRGISREDKARGVV